jgi:hypothetical protein
MPFEEPIVSVPPAVAVHRVRESFGNPEAADLRRKAFISLRRRTDRDRADERGEENDFPHRPAYCFLK